MEIWELNWNEFEMPDGLTASWAYDKDTDMVHMSIDDHQLPEHMGIKERLSQCYNYFFTEIYPIQNLK